MGHVGEKNPLGYDPIFYGVKFNCKHGVDKWGKCRCDNSAGGRKRRSIGTDCEPSSVIGLFKSNPVTIGATCLAAAIAVCLLVKFSKSRRASSNNQPVEVALLPQNTVEVCRYGDKCYRKNPEHIERFHRNR